MKMRTKTKKAILLPEGLKIIIAVLCIILLVYLAASLYNIFIKKTALEQAKETLEQIVAEINGLEEGEEDSYLLTVPKDWFIGFYNQGGDMPKQCKGKNCLCICSGWKPGYYQAVSDTMTDSLIKERIGKCDKEGVCKNLEESVKNTEVNSKNRLEDYILIYGIFNLFFEKGGEVIEFSLSKLGGKEGELFDKFLSSKSNFIDKGEISIEEQILSYVNSNNKNEKNDLTKNVQDYFRDYDFPIWVSLREEGKGSDLPSILAIEAGVDRELNEGELVPQWPTFIIDNSQGNFKKIVITIDWRRK